MPKYCDQLLESMKDTVLNLNLPLIPASSYLLVFFISALIYVRFQGIPFLFRQPLRYLLLKVSTWLDDGPAFSQDPIGFLNERIDHLGSVYRIKLGGIPVTVFNHMEGINWIVRDPTRSLSSYNLLAMIVRNVGAIDMPLSSTLMTQLVRLVAHHFSARSFSEIAPCFNHYLRQELSHAYSARSTDIPLSSFIGRSFYHATSRAIWGPSYPLETYNFLHIVETSILQLVTAPLCLRPQNVANAQAQMQAALGQFLDKSKEQNYAGVPQIIADFLEGFQASDLPQADLPAALSGFLIAFQHNTTQLASWIIIHFLSHPKLLARLQEEVDRIVDVEFGGIHALLAATPQHPGALESPMIHSSLMECLRLSTAPVIIREVLVDTNIPVDKHRFTAVAAGELVMANGVSLNFDNNLFDDPSTFRMDRFLGKEAWSPLAIAFGGGVHLCKGRDLALFQLKMFMVLCIRMFNIEAKTEAGVSLVDHQIKHESSKTMPTGVVVPAEEVYLTLSPRADMVLYESDI
ncbi:cytochrome P450 [Panus rudis PR-1116 ss-1]|nr:cytochrome P450 [Panus rudis PR-1116 ss-1]